MCFSFPLWSTSSALYERSCRDAAQHGDSWNAGPKWPHTVWWKQLLGSQGSLMMSFPREKMPNFRVVDPSGIAKDKPSCLLWLLDVFMASKAMRWPGRLDMGYYTVCGSKHINKIFLISLCLAFLYLAVWMFLWHHLRWKTTEWCVIILKCSNIRDFHNETLHEWSWISHLEVKIELTSILEMEQMACRSRWLFTGITPAGLSL